MKILKNFILLTFMLALVACGSDGAGDGTLAQGGIGRTCAGVASGSVILDDLQWKHFLLASDVNEEANASAVGHLRLPASHSYCTGFLINENTMMTNNHCIGRASDAVGAKLHMRRNDGSQETFVCDQFIITNASLDFTLVKCQNDPGKKYGFVALSDRRASVGDPMYVVQENCDYIGNPYCNVDKFIAYGTINQSRTTVIGHNADTLGGSSGSPIFAGDTDELIGIHNAGQQNTSNYGVPMNKIREYIKTNAPQVVTYDYVEGDDSYSYCSNKDQ